MRELNCLIVEDEALAAGIIRDYIGQVPGLVCKGICQNALIVGEKLRSESIDIIFLDIQLPGISGLDFSRSLKGDYHIIFTTAYHQHALEAFNLNATDYLLKPIEFSRFLQAIHKVYALVKPENSSPAPEKSTGGFHFFVSGKKNVRVSFADILYVESQKDYITIHTRSGPVTTKFPISEMEQMLSSDSFCRVHKSFIINTNQLTAYNSQEVEIASKKIPIGRTYAELFRSVIEEKRS